MKYRGPIFQLTNQPFSTDGVAGGGFVKATYLEAIDGDTAYFIIDGQKEKVRFFVVDTPEIFPKQEKYSIEAKNYAHAILKYAQTIFLQSDPSDSLRDNTPSKRLLAWVWVNRQLLNYKLVEKGYAQIKYIFGENMMYLDDLKQAEQIAKEKNRRLFHK